MGWPNNSAAREAAISMLARWLDTGEDNDAAKHLAEIDEEWGHVADLVHLHLDIDQGGHLKSRGGASVGKAVYLLSKTAKTRGTRPANAWKSWEKYKDVAHLIAAAILVCGDMDTIHRKKSLGLDLQQLLPLRVVLLVPELIIAVGLAYEKYGLAYVPKGGTQPMFNHQTLWRIPEDINVVPPTSGSSRRCSDTRSLITPHAIPVSPPVWSPRLRARSTCCHSPGARSPKKPRGAVNKYR
jgi:hypothetical protein